MHAVAHSSRDANIAACSGSHPHHIVIAPLDIHVMVLHQVIQDHIRMRATVENIADDVQHIYRHAFDERCHFDNKSVCAAGIDNSADDIVIVAVAVGVGRSVEQLFHNVGKFFGKRFAHLGAGILGSRKPANGDEPSKHYAIPIVKIRYGGFGFNELFAGVIDQRRKRAPLCDYKRAFKRLVDLVGNSAGTVVENVQERFMLPVDITHEVFRALGQI